NDVLRFRPDAEPRERRPSGLVLVEPAHALREDVGDARVRHVLEPEHCERIAMVFETERQSVVAQGALLSFVVRRMPSFTPMRGCQPRSTRARSLLYSSRASAERRR